MKKQAISDKIFNLLIGKPIMSQKTAIANNPLIEDVEQEMSNIEEDSVLGLGDAVQ